jgi:hypothetical protein
MITETAKKVLRIKVERKRSTQRKVTKVKIQARFKKRAKNGIKKSNELLVKVAIGEKLATEGGVMEIADPGRSVVRQTHIRLLMRFVRKIRKLVKKRMSTGMVSKSIKDPITVGVVTNETSKEGMGTSKTRRLALKAGGKKISKGGLHFSLNMKREKVKPKTKRAVVAKRVEWGDETTVVLGVLNDTIPPSREIKKRVSSEGRKVLLKVLLILGVEATIRHISKEEVLVQVDDRSTDRIVKKHAMIGTRGKPGDNGAGGSIDNHIQGIMHIALIIVPGSTLTRRGRSGTRAMSKEGAETQGVREAGALNGIPGRIRRWSGVSRRSRRRSRSGSGSGSRSRSGNGSGARKMIKWKGARSRNGIWLKTEIAIGRSRCAARARRDRCDGCRRRGWRRGSKWCKRWNTHGTTKGRRERWVHHARGSSRRRGSSLHGTSNGSINSSSDGIGKERQVRDHQGGRSRRWDNILRDSGKRVRQTSRSREERRRVGVGTKSAAEDATSLTREDHEHTERRLNRQGRVHVMDASLKEVQSEFEVRSIPGGKRDTVAQIFGGIR